MLLGDAPNRSATSFAVKPEGQPCRVSRMRLVLILIRLHRYLHRVTFADARATLIYCSII
jgi:hypothetical protein